MTPDLRSRALAAIDDLDGVGATGPAVLRRLRERSFAGKTGAATVAEAAAEAVDAGATSPDEPDLYPVLHRLEADWQIRATWQAGADGTLHRTYQRRRLMHGRPSRTGSN
jgi:hypothetical protein